MESGIVSGLGRGAEGEEWRVESTVEWSGAWIVENGVRRMESGVSSSSVLCIISCVAHFTYANCVSRAH